VLDVLDVFGAPDVLDVLDVIDVFDVLDVMIINQSTVKFLSYLVTPVSFELFKTLLSQH